MAQLTSEMAVNCFAVTILVVLVSYGKHSEGGIA